MTFHDPWWWLTALLPPALAWTAARVGRASLRLPTVDGLEPAAHASGACWQRVPLALRCVVLLAIVIALARPQQGLQPTRLTTEGIDIVLLVDVSGSMLAEDFESHGRRQNRLAVVKEVVREFIDQRPHDRLGLVVFAGRPYTACPLTLDHGWLLAQLERVEIGTVEDGTAIGSAIASGLNRLRHSKAKSRVLVLLTDGVNNAGTVTPDVAAQMARVLEVKLYAIGAGTKGLAPFPATDVFGRNVYQQVKIEVDDEGLTRLAQTTGGQYFRATDTASLRHIYAQIDRLEKTTIEQPQYQDYREWYPSWILAALLVLAAELALRETWLRVLP